MARSIRPIGGRSQSRCPAACASRSPKMRSDEGVGFHAAMRRQASSRFCPATFRRAARRSRAGFLFDVPVRFDTDYLEVDLSAFAAGAIPKIPLVEIRP